MTEYCKDLCAGSWDAGQKRISCDGVACRGATDLLKATFSPSFNYKKAARASACVRQSKTRGGGGGRREGVRLDGYLSEWAEHGAISARRLNNPKIRAVYDEFRARGWLPLAAQFPVACQALELGTLIDLVLVNREGEIVLVELKVNFRGYWTTEGQGAMAHPFEAHAMSAQRAHFVQAAFAQWLFLHCAHQHRERTFGASYVVRVCGRESTADPDDVSVDVVRVPAEFTSPAATRALLGAVCLRRDAYVGRRRKRRRRTVGDSSTGRRFST